MKTDTIIKHINEDRVFNVMILGGWIEINKGYGDAMSELEGEFPLGSEGYNQVKLRIDKHTYTTKEKWIKKFLKDKYRLKRLSISKQSLKELIEYLDGRLDNLLKENEVFYNHKWE